MNLEISENPKVLFDPSVPVAHLQLLGRRLYDGARLLDLDKAIDAAGKNPDGVLGCQHREGRLFYIRDGVEVEYLLSERIAAVVESGGWLSFPHKYGFRIRYRKIVEFNIRGGILDFFQNFSKSDVVERFGQPDLVDEHITYGDLMRTTFVYDRKLRVSYDDWDNKVDAINIGESLMYNEGGKTEGPWPVTH